MIRFFKKLFKRGDFMTRADKAYYKYRAKTIFWSTFCMIIIAWVGTNLVLCALTTNVGSNFDMIYEAGEPTVLPIGKEIWKYTHKSKGNKIPSEFEFGFDNAQGDANITFDKYNSDGKFLVDGVDIVELCEGENIVEISTGTKFYEKVTVNDDISAYYIYFQGKNEIYAWDRDIYFLSNKKIYANPDSSFMFYWVSHSHRSFTFNNFDTSLVTNMMGMFAGDEQFEEDSIFLNTAALNFGKDVHIAASSGDPRYGSIIENLDLSSWNTKNVVNAYGMFYATRFVNQGPNLSGWDTSKVTNMSHMFYAYGGSMKTLDLSSFDTSSVQYFDKMIIGTDDLQSVYVSDRWNLPESVIPSGCSVVQKEYTGK